MSQYSESYTGPLDQGGLVTNPRYEAQAGETLPQGNDGRGPYQESRYGAVPLGTGIHNPVDTIRDPAAYGFKKQEPEGFRFPGTAMNDRNAAGVARIPESEFGREQLGYGQPGFGAPSQGQNTSSLWPSPAAPPNAHRSDLVGQGDAPREGIMDTLKNAVGMGPNSANNNATGYGEPPPPGRNS